MAKLVLQYATIVAAIVCFLSIGVIIRKRATKTYGFLLGLLGVRGAMAVITIAILFHRHALSLSVAQAYTLYFYSYWTSAVLQLVLKLLVIYAVYRVAMKPLDGLRRIGNIIFRWVAAVSIVLSTVVALGPHTKGTIWFDTLMSQAQQGECVLTVCLLVFVCFAARPLGLNFRSRAFGVALALGIESTASLVLSAWLATSSAQSLYSPVFAAGSVFSVVSVGVMLTYFALPEPERKLILLPTTSPYFLWNRISEALGDDPGVVAVAGFTPAMLTSAELTAIGSAKRLSVANSLPKTESLLPQPYAAAR